MSEFKREERYIVVKLKDLTKEQIEYLRIELETQDIPTRECAVVEPDWPNYEQTWRDIEAVANGTFVERKEPVWLPNVGEVCLLDGEEVTVKAINGKRCACQLLIGNQPHIIPANVNQLEPIVRTNDDLNKAKFDHTRASTILKEAQAFRAMRGKPDTVININMTVNFDGQFTEEKAEEVGKQISDIINRRARFKDGE